MSFRYEVLLGDQWVPYSAEALSVGEDDVDPQLTGMVEIPEVWDEPVTFAQQELTKASSSVAVEDPGLEKLAGLRILLWQDTPAQGEPDVVLRASGEQMALGRLRRAAEGVSWALRGVQEARSRLRSQVLLAATADRLGRNQIAREIGSTWTRRLVLQYLAGHDLIRDIRAALPPDWMHHDGYDVVNGGGDEWENRLGPFWCGPVMLELSTQGLVGLRIVDLKEGPHYKATEEEVQAHQADARQRALEAAEVVHAALTRRGLMLVLDDGKVPGSAGREVSIEELARAGVSVVRRPPQASPWA